MFEHLHVSDFNRQLFFGLLLASVLVFSSFTPASAQTPIPPLGPTYIVQDGDTLWSIAIRFNVGMSDIISANHLSSEYIFVGDRLIIPGLEGINGLLATEAVPFGENLRSLSRQHRIPQSLLLKLNHIVSPNELYAGISLVLLEQEDKPAWSARSSLGTGETLLEIAVLQGTNPWTISEINVLAGPWAAVPGDVLYLPSGSAETGSTGLPPAFDAVGVTPMPLIQGGATQIRVTTTLPVTLTGLLVDQPLRFFQEEDGAWVALQGVHAMLEPGLYPLRLEAVPANGARQVFEQMVLVTSGYYPQDPELYVDPETIDPAITGPENDLIYSVVASASAEKYWQGLFHLPVAEPFCIKSWYGNRRSYNGSGYIYFHTGADYGICADVNSFDIYAPAAGVVVFSSLLTVRGNATIIDHGWGIYSGFWHQAQSYVTVGEYVEAGQLIGQIGKTGRVTGPHLHWEVWVNNTQVNPLEWLVQEFPH